MFKSILSILCFSGLLFSQIQYDGVPEFYENRTMEINFIQIDKSVEIDRNFAPMVFQFGNEYDVDINVLELSQQLPPLPTRGAERVAAASLQYPVIVVKSGGQYRFVLDGNHRLQKAIDEEVESIKAKILDLDNPETPEVFKRMFGGAG